MDVGGAIRLAIVDRDAASLFIRMQRAFYLLQ
jgi:hypothetical protein